MPGADRSCVDRRPLCRESRPVCLEGNRPRSGAQRPPTPGGRSFPGYGRVLAGGMHGKGFGDEQGRFVPSFVTHPFWPFGRATPPRHAASTSLQAPVRRPCRRGCRRSGPDTPGGGLAHSTVAVAEARWQSGMPISGSHPLNFTSRVTCMSDMNTTPECSL
jgi:hypothetical protein